ncbi:hypothetical protein LTR50_005675 [Elasticomyces elasticus]|nr:hypothetical protein LTR50_005675 [Elasticomyces elasticus]
MMNKTSGFGAGFSGATEATLANPFLGNFSQDIDHESTVDYQINITANTGDFGALNGTFHICDYLEELHQPPDAEEPAKVCPPSEGAVLIDYAFWFADWLVAPGQWSVKFDAKTPEGDRIYCLETQFSLQCPPEHDGPECLRGGSASDSFDVNAMLRGIKKRLSSGGSSANLQ